MDDVADLIQDSSRDHGAVRRAPHDRGDRCAWPTSSVKCCERVQHAVKLLPQDQPSPTIAEAALKTCEEIDRLESDADRVMRCAMSKLFREEPDVREVIKLKADLRAARDDHRQVRGRGQRDRGHRPRELLSARRARWQRSRSPSGWWCCWSCWRSLFDFMNGFHDAANSIATVVSTGVLKPQPGGACSRPSSTSSRSSSST